MVEPFGETGVAGLGVGEEDAKPTKSVRCYASGDANCTVECVGLEAREEMKAGNK